jgi:hypothetical protein
MADFLAWPAFGGTARQELAAWRSRELRTRRGIWGKVHGARTDFRWIARAPGLGAGAAAIEELVWVGDEEQPAKACLWRAATSWLAVSVRPSRAVDRVGRRGFCEKQVLEWAPEEPANAPPAVAVALTTLPRAEALDDSLWWDRAPLLRDAPELVLPIREADAPAVRLDETTLEAAVTRGLEDLARIAALRDLQPSLAALYTSLLGSAAGPAILRGLLEPLPASALAALLLPLPRPVAERVSIAGWLFSPVPDLARLRCNWDVVVLPPSCRVPTAAEPRASAEGLRLADALLDGRPPAPPRARPAPAGGSRMPAEHLPGEPAELAAEVGRPGASLPLRGPGSDAPPMVRALFEFARACDRRWLAPEILEAAYRAAPAAVVGAVDGALLQEWIGGVAAGRPASAHSEQWAVKVDLLRAAALALMPTADTWQQIGAFESALVPPLLFAPVLVAGPGMLGERLGPRAYQECVTASRECRSYRLRRVVERWLDGWADDLPRG